MFARSGWAACLLVALLGGCIQQQMADKGRIKPYDPSGFFADGAAMRLPPAHTVAQDAIVGRAPRPALTRGLVLEGQTRYGIYCAPCHGLVGNGLGVIPAHGFPVPPSFHQDRLRAATGEHFYDVITAGYGVMYPYANRVAPRERWAIVAYIRALQLSQDAPAAEGGPR